MSMKKWIDVKDIGELYTEEVLVFFDVPLLFVCKNNQEKRFLILCIDEEEGTYLCSPITNEWLLKLLTNEIPMVDVFKQPSDGQNILIEYNFEEKQFNGRYIDVSELTSDMLPDEGAYFELKNEKISNYIAKLNLECSKYNSIYINRSFSFDNQHIIHSKSNKDNIIIWWTNAPQTHNGMSREYILNKKYNILRNNRLNKSLSQYKKMLTYKPDLFTINFNAQDYNTNRSDYTKCPVKI